MRGTASLTVVLITTNVMIMMRSMIMNKHRLVTIKGLLYRGFEIDGQLYVVMSPIGKSGDCIRG